MNAIAATLTVEPLWQRTRASFARAIAAIGAPAAIAAIALLTRELRAAIVARLHRLEHTVRKLLLAEAAELHRLLRAAAARPNCAPRIEMIQLRSFWTAGLQARTASATAAQNCAPEGARSRVDLRQPQTWRADFSFALPRDPRRVSDAHAPRIRALWGPDPKPEPQPTYTPRIINDEEDSPLRLARRLEALRRVLQNPLTYAQRLARLLVAAVRRFPHAARTYAWATSRTNAYDPHDERLSVEAYGPALDDWAAFEDSS